MMNIGFREAVDLARAKEEVKEATEVEDYFINSVIGVYMPKKNKLDRWIITFYSPSRKEVIQGVVRGKKDVAFKGSKEPLNPTTKELDIDSINFDEQQAMKMAEDSVPVPKSKIVQILMTLRQKETPSWNINIITSSFDLYSISINAEKGEVTDKEIRSLVKSREGLPFL